MRLTKMAFGWGELALVAVGMVAVSFLSGRAFADDPYADYVKLTRKDGSKTSSWNAVGGWSDGREPHADTNYYVSGTLYRNANTTATNRFWNGGQLVIAGTFTSNVSQGDRYAPYIADLVLLPGSLLHTPCYGPLYMSPYDTSLYGTVTIKGTAANPSKITQTYNGSRTGNGFRSHSFKARFVGTADSYLTFTRPFINSSTALDHGFFCKIGTVAFADYPGTFKVFGGNTIVKSEDDYKAVKWPQTAVVVEDNADFFLYYGNAGTLNDSTTNATMRSFSLNGAKILYNYNATIKSPYPILNVTEHFSVEEGSAVGINAVVGTIISGNSSENPDGISLRIAHLTGDAAANLGDFPPVKVMSSGQNYMPGTNGALRAIANGDGSKDIYLAFPGLVTMTNSNVETDGYPEGATRYSAFEPGHAGDWSNGETPTGDSQLHYWAIQRLCFFSSFSFPNARLTISKGSSWKAGSSLTFKEFSLYTGIGFGLWGDDTKRTFTAERFNVINNGTDASNASLYCGQKKALAMMAELCGDGCLVIKNMNNQEASIDLNGMGTNFHGRLTVQQDIGNAASLAPYQFTAYLRDARCWGGEYTLSTNIFDAIYITKFPRVMVTNDVVFTEPTRGMLVKEGAKFEIAAGRTMRIENQITFAGVLDKAGAGTFDLAGDVRYNNGAPYTLPTATTNVLNILAGALKVSSKKGADGLAVTFSEGTRLIIPADSEDGYYNVKWDAPLTINTTSGKLPVEVELTGSEGTGDITVPICTFNATAAADIPETAFIVRRASNGFRLKAPVAKRTNGDGSVTYLATLGMVGTQFLIR